MLIWGKITEEYAIKELTILSRENGAVFYMIAGKTKQDISLWTMKKQLSNQGGQSDQALVRKILINFGDVRWKSDVQ